MPSDFVDVNTLRKPIGSTGDDPLWRSIEEFRDRVRQSDMSNLRNEFPSGAASFEDEPSRRQFLKLMAASFGLAGLHGCARPPDEKILPYVQMPEHQSPGKPLYFATAMPMHGFGWGVVVESHAGRPTKVEGNNLHPASMGATNAFAQASVLTLYDPDRSQAIRHRGTISTRSAFASDLRQQLDNQKAKRGAGLFVLTESVSSPTLIRQLKELREIFPEFHWHQYEPVLRDSEWLGGQMAFGEPVQTIYQFDRAGVVLSLDADFLDVNSWPIAYARQFISRRRIENPGKPQMSRLYVVECTPTITGSKADHRLSLNPGKISRLTRALAKSLGIDVGPGDSELPIGVSESWFNALVADLKNDRPSDAGSSCVVVGPSQPPEIHALGHSINRALGNHNQTVRYVEPVHQYTQPPLQSIRELNQAMLAGQVELLLILQANPVFTAPADLEFATAMEKVGSAIHLGLYYDETAARCQWHVPAAHFLESWGDIRAFDGTASIIQPLIAPLYDGWSEHQLLSQCLDRPDESPYDTVQGTWRSQWGDAEFNSLWEDALQQGVVAGTSALPAVAAATIRSPAQPDRIEPPSPANSGEFTAIFRPDPSIWDGRWANNGWLQELPKSLTSLTWDNAALVSAGTAERLSLVNGDVVRLIHESREIRAPVWILPNQSDDCVTLHFGYGSRSGGRVATNTGTDVYPLRTSDAMEFARGVRVIKTGSQYPLAATQNHHGMEDRHPVEHGELQELQKNPHHPSFLHQDSDAPTSSFYPPWPYDGYKWGMVIDLTACIGCGACVTACQAENNIPIVGKDQIGRGREMHWLRIDTYYQGPISNPQTFHQPVPCMHCENAPCEVVCPVAATTHSDEGLNEMTYNRCIGTRYCANNCPYKVRRFNFLQYSDYDTPVLKLLRNPDVTVRTRGVMEKCTYCVQRINTARIQAQKEDRTIKTGEVETACQAACPTIAIHFGDLNNPADPIRLHREHPLNYSLLQELNTRPRTTYLAEVRNRNPAIE